MSDVKPSPVKSAYSRGGGRGGGRSGGQGGWDDYSNRSSSSHLQKRKSRPQVNKYKYGGDIRSSIKKSTRFAILLPLVPADTVNALTRTIAAKKIDLYVKRDGILDDNLRKAFSLIFGQCTELLKSKLKSSVNWDAMSSTYDMFALLEAIKTIIYKFGDQK